ncbi:MAG: hypothetical protein GY835_27940 [bacterium]|nr:hypothetical protein [bacterium]
MIRLTRNIGLLALILLVALGTLFTSFHSHELTICCDDADADPCETSHDDCELCQFERTYLAVEAPAAPELAGITHVERLVRDASSAPSLAAIDFSFSRAPPLTA